MRYSFSIEIVFITISKATESNVYSTTKTSSGRLVARRLIGELITGVFLALKGRGEPRAAQRSRDERPVTGNLRDLRKSAGAYVSPFYSSFSSRPVCLHTQGQLHVHVLCKCVWSERREGVVFVTGKRTKTESEKKHPEKKGGETEKK